MAAYRKLGQLLLEYRLITEAQLNEALEMQKKVPAPLGRLLVRLGHVTNRALNSVVATQFGVRPWYLDESPPTSEALSKVPPGLCRALSVLPVALQGDLLTLAMTNPSDMDALEAVRRGTGLRIEAVFVEMDSMQDLLGGLIHEVYGNHQEHSQENVRSFVDRALELVELQSKTSQIDELTDAETRPMVGLVNQILAEAIRAGASDIHIEPRSSKVEVRYRVDGMLRKAGEIPSQLLPMLVARMKIMADLDIVEYRVPQDGRISVTVEGREIDLRVSVLPNHNGQRIVMRILDKKRSLKSLSEIGFNDHNLAIFRQMIRQPYGMFLVTGPTGSGKTTSLYAALKEIREDHINVMTCEDPIEYDLDGVNQSQVNEKVGLTFARQLRAILRQDPDIILVGEIRDSETAETALRAAMTGHLVLSTLHTNDSVGAIPRLCDMGLDASVLSSSLLGVMSQRLVRTLCPDCKQTKTLNAEDRKLFADHGFDVTSTFISAGCPRCDSAGFKGRRPVTEILPITGSVASAVSMKAPTVEIYRRAMERGLVPMQFDALGLVAQGLTSLEEIKRVVVFEDIETTPILRLEVA